jgi:hypothetical protein
VASLRLHATAARPTSIPMASIFIVISNLDLPGLVQRRRQQIRWKFLHG